MWNQHDTHPTAPPKRDNRTTADTPNHRRELALLITILCLSISQFYFYLGGSSSGRNAFRQITISSSRMSITTSRRAEGYWSCFLCRCCLLVRLVIYFSTAAIAMTTPNNPNLMCVKLLRHHRRTARQAAKAPVSSVSFSIWKETILNPRRFALVFIILPCLVFSACNISRHYRLFLTSYPSSSDTAEHWQQTTINHRNRRSR